MQPSMHRGVYRLKSEIVAILNDNGHKSITILQPGTILSLTSEAPSDPRFVFALWVGQRVSVFKNDFEDRTHLIMG